MPGISHLLMKGMRSKMISDNDLGTASTTRTSSFKSQVNSDRVESLGRPLHHSASSVKQFFFPGKITLFW